MRSLCWGRGWWVSALVALALTLLMGRARAEDVGADAAACAPETAGARGACSVDDGADAGVTSATAAPVSTASFVFFWGEGCPHCEEARPLVDELARVHPEVSVERVEVRRDARGRARFVATMSRLGVEAAGIPTFVRGDRFVVGFTPGESEPRVRALFAGADPTADSSSSVRVPWIGIIDPRAVSLPWLTAVVGLADGLNPCAMWVLVVLLGILLHVRTPGRLALYAGTFVAMSGVVYFAFMVAWSLVFQLAGLSRLVTTLLGLALVGMGALNLKDLVWFKRGPSLVIPDRVKPRLYARMRTIARSASTPAALAGVVALAFMVNLVELGCTLGLPAVYTRILSLRGMTAGARVGYIALYNVFYVVPLLVIVVVFAAVRRRVVMSERTARALKGLSGAMLALFGVIFIAAPDLLASR